MAAGTLRSACEVSRYTTHVVARPLIVPCRLYHAARLRWNSIERRRGPLEDSLIDDVTQWSMWNYATGKFDLFALSLCMLTILLSQRVSAVFRRRTFCIKTCRVPRPSQALLESLCNVRTFSVVRAGNVSLLTILEEFRWRQTSLSSSSVQVTRAWNRR